MAPDVRSSGGGTVGSFDFNSNAGVLGVLAAIRASSLPASERNELRDMVFLYSNGGHDSGVKSMIEQRLAANGIVPLSSTAPTTIAAAPVVMPSRLVSGFAGSRPAPTFTTPTSVPVSPTPTPVTISPVVPPQSASSLPVAQPQVVVVPIPTPTPTVVMPVVPVSMTPPAVLSELPQMAVPSPAVPPPQSAPQPTPPPPVLMGTDPASPRLERIKKIKTDINERVGNPVNLVDIDNLLGREYMSALLDAMKLLSTASESESATAMGRLEAVYAQVMTRLQTSGVVLPQTSAVTPTAAVILEPVIVEPIVRTIPVQSQEFVGSRDVTAQPVAAALILPPVFVAPVQPPVPQPSPEENKIAETAWNTPEIVTPPPAPAPVVVVSPIAPPTGPTGATPLMSVAATAVPLRTPADLPSADSLQSSSVTGDSRYTKEVDDGLNQLLSEWTLFKKSGLFGTGPHGKDHPLFLKIASLQIPIILSGRFEGSTQEIKQSITDYMNGWRYEQGIIYDQGETFEQYLRRVIRHIIDLQNRRRAS